LTHVFEVNHYFWYLRKFSILSYNAVSLKVHAETKLVYD